MSDHKLEAAIGDGADLVVTDAMRQAVWREQCQLGGHDFDVEISLDYTPQSVVCGRCGKTWHVETRPG